MNPRDVVRTHPKVPVGSVFTVSAGHDWLAELGITDIPEDVAYVVLLHPDDTEHLQAYGVASCPAE